MQGQVGQGDIFGCVLFELVQFRAGMFDLGEAYPKAYPLNMLLL